MSRSPKGRWSAWADDRYSLLIVLQALDAAGKDSTIKHVMSGVNPQGCQVKSFKQPSAEELEHDFLWRPSGSSGTRTSTAFEHHLARQGDGHPEVLPQRFERGTAQEVPQATRRPLQELEVPLSDVAERAYWDDYVRAYEACIDAVSTEWAPWWV